MTRAPTRAAALCTALLGLSCGPDRPVVLLTVVPSRDGASIESLVRVRMIVRRCDEDRLAFAGDLPFPRGTDQPVSDPALEASVPPGVPFYVWLQGWEPCGTEDLCTPEDSATAGDCLCVTSFEPPRQRLTREGCSEWLSLAEGETLPLSLTLGPAAGLCPPSGNPCASD